MCTREMTRVEGGEGKGKSEKEKERRISHVSTHCVLFTENYLLCYSLSTACCPIALYVPYLSPLIFATKENCVEIVLKLIEHGADVNAKDKVRKVQSDNGQ